MSSFKEFYESTEGKPRKRKKNKKLDNACWDGYEAIGTKTKNGKEVPNCVPIKNEGFKDFYGTIEDEKVDEEMMNEEAATIVLAILGIPSVIALTAWVGSLMLVSYTRALGRLSGKVFMMWRDLVKDLPDYFKKDAVKNAVVDLSKNERSKSQVINTEKNKRAFEKELKLVYEAIERKDFNTAKEEFERAPKYIKNNPDVFKVIISEISKVLKEPPVYINSPGNETYRAIKKVINIRVAKAAAYATKMTMERSIRKNVENSTEEIDSEEEIETEDQGL